MVTLIEINKAINDSIKGALALTEYNPNELIVAEDVSEPIIRPSIKVAIENSTNGKFNANCREKNLTCRVYFFAKDRNKYKLDNVKMQELLENTFIEGLKIKEGFHIPIESVESEVTDTVLICSFDLYVVELLPEATTNPIGELIEPMEALELKLEKE
jgi:hypothetical protein